MHIPVKYSKDFYGDIGNYNTKTNNHEYSLTFTCDNKVKINLCVDGKREIPSHKINYIGVDVNEKNNLFCASNGEKIGYNDKLLNEICDELLIIDNLKKNDTDYKVGKKKMRKLSSMRNKMRHSNIDSIVNLCKMMVKEGFDHAVFENLTNSFGRSFFKKGDINYNRRINELHLSSVKDEFEHVCRKYGIAFSTVRSEYTSKMCPVCGCIDDSNRINQESFTCVKCLHSNNADVNAAVNIRDRVAKTVFSDLSVNNPINNGTYLPNDKLTISQVKNILIKIFQEQSISNIDRDVGRCCTMYNFDHV
jgi:IS605 OrfB family transposase